jgi:hypothetical protein
MNLVLTKSIIALVFFSSFPLFTGSYGERAGVRAKLAVDQAWQEEYFQKILPMLQHQENITLHR